MGFICGLIKRMIISLLFLISFIALIVLIPNLPPYSKFTAYKLEPSLPREGPLAPNSLLNNAKRLYEGKILGPEVFEIYKDEVYTSLASGEIVKVSPGGHVTFVTKIGKPCSSLLEEEKCGRPLDFKIDVNTNQMYVMDAYHGIWKVDLKTDKKQLLVSPHVEIEGHKPKLFNGIALMKNGDFYWTDSTYEFLLKDGFYITFSDPTGRLFHYNAAKNTSKVLVDKLNFANGVVLSPESDFVVVAESTGFKLVKVYVSGANKGKVETFVSGLPGTPDNIRVLPDGSGILVGLFTVYDEQNPILIRSMTQLPAIRKFIARFMRLIEAPFEYLDSFYPHDAFKAVTYHVGSFKSMSAFLPPMSGLVHVDWNGKILGSYYNTDKSLVAISDAVVYKDQLYLGSPHSHDFIGAVPAPEALKKAFTAKKSSAQATKKEEVKATAKPAEAKPTTQKPIETKPTPKPVEVKPTTQKPATKPTTQKPVETKPTTQKPVETKPTTQKPVETKPATQKPVETKPTTQKPVETKPTTQKPVETKPTTQKPVETKPTPKPAEVKPTPKPAEAKPTTPKPSKKENTVPNMENLEQPIIIINNNKKEPSKASEQQPAAPKRNTPEQIPITEEIPSDTVKPGKEKLKVIKKQGPTEMPLPKN